MYLSVCYTVVQPPLHAISHWGGYRESSSRTRNLFNLPFLVLKARHLGGFAICNLYRLRVAEQALGMVVWCEHAVLIQMWHASCTLARLWITQCHYLLNALLTVVSEKCYPLSELFNLLFLPLDFLEGVANGMFPPCWRLPSLSLSLTYLQATKVIRRVESTKTK